MKLWQWIPLAVLLSTAPAVAEAGIEFNRDIRPILSDKCFACHGPDEKSRKAELRLDVRESAVDSGAFVPEDAVNSSLIERIDSDDETLLMPPPEYEKPLTEEERKLLKQWIQEGAPYQLHWSLEELKRPPLPLAKKFAPANPIDAFIRARLEEEGVAPNPKADPRTLVRRLSFDLTGLPPDPEAVAKFEASPNAAAYEQLVNELLASPHYGERLAMYWLDLVRYADTLGYHGDQVRSVSPYRDYVIKAFNENKPFSEFTIEQLAGDLLPEPTLEQKVASTYNRLNRASAEGGVQPKEYLAKYSADRVRTTGAVWLGFTFGCAECHDHKFDPFTTHDFYSFAAFFADIKEQGIVGGANYLEQMPVPTPEQSQRLTELTEAIGKAETEYGQEFPDFEMAQTQWEKEVQSQIERWNVLHPIEITSAGGATFTQLDDHSILASGKNPEKDVYTISTIVEEWSTADGPISLRLELLPDPSLPSNGPGRAGNGNLVLHQVEMTLNGQPVKWSKATASHTQNGHSPQFIIENKPNGWAILPKTGQAVTLLLSGEVNKDAAAEASTGPAKIEIRLHHNYGSSHTIGKFRLAVSNDPAAADSLDASYEQVRSLVAIPNEKRTDEQSKILEKAFREQTPVLKEVRDRLASLRQQKVQLQKSLVTTLVTVSVEPRTMRVLPRGDWMDESGDVVKANVPHFLPQIELEEDRPLNRLDLANWMVSKENPLVARTFVNRLWMLYFGHGLARSVDDLGSQGEVPTHPQLLDWLASEFIESGWDIKHLVKLIATSETYQQTSSTSKELRQRDPYNRLYARQTSWRLEAEMIRDQALAVSGLLHDQIGGVSAMPYQPAGYWAQLNFPKRKYQHDTGENQYRRGVYTHWQRTFLHPSLLAFDAPAREECTAQRPRSNTPLQSLVLLNDPTFIEAARALAMQMLQQAPGSFEERLAWLTSKTLMRSPRVDESRLLKQMYESDLARYREDPQQAQALLQVGLFPTAEGIDQAELAAWTGVCRAFLNLHESITRY